MLPLVPGRRESMHKSPEDRTRIIILRAQKSVICMECNGAGDLVKTEDDGSYRSR